MVERFKRVPDDGDAARGLIETRIGMGITSDNEVKWVMQNVYPRVARSKYRALLKDRNKTFKGLSVSKATHEEDGCKMSRVMNCVSIVLGTLAIDFRNSAAECLVDEKLADEDKKKYFKFFFDLSMGSQSSLYPLMTAENELRGTAEEQKLESVSYVGKTMNISMGGQGDHYLRLKIESAEALKLLIADPRGFLLADTMLEKIKDASVFPNMTRAYLIAGAELAGNLYKKVYEIAEPLYHQQRPK